MAQEPAARSPGPSPITRRPSWPPRAFSTHRLSVKADRRPRPWKAGSTLFNCGGFTAFLRWYVSPAWTGPHQQEEVIVVTDTAHTGTREPPGTVTEVLGPLMELLGVRNPL